MALIKIKVISVPVVRSNRIHWLDLAAPRQLQLWPLLRLQAVDVNVLGLVIQPVGGV
jgi:hypothetical protein